MNELKIKYKDFIKLDISLYIYDKVLFAFINSIPKGQYEPNDFVIINPRYLQLK